MSTGAKVGVSLVASLAFLGGVAFFLYRRKCSVDDGPATEDTKDIEAYDDDYDGYHDEI
jgi:hypothetical protein